MSKATKEIINDAQTSTVKIVELLIFVDDKNSLCKTDNSFNSLLQANSDIVIIQKNKIKYKNTHFNYSLKSDTLNKKNEKGKFFNIKISLNDISDEKIESFSELIRHIKNIFSTVLNQLPQTLWDDISYYYSIQAYPVIHEIENILRKLITKFMLINVGTVWTVNSIPDDFKTPKKINPSSNAPKPSSHNLLYDTDFIQLSNFLFDEYREIDIPSLISKIKSIGSDTSNENIIEDIKKFIPKSNWQKHFQKHIACEAEFLKKRWLKLYDLRCKIAHNNTFTKADLAETLAIVNEIKPTLLDATNKLEVIEISDNEKVKLTDEINFRDPDNLPLHISLEENPIRDPRSYLLRMNKAIKRRMRSLSQMAGGTPYLILSRVSKELVQLNIISPKIHELFMMTNKYFQDPTLLDELGDSELEALTQECNLIYKSLRRAANMIIHNSQ